MPEKFHDILHPRHPLKRTAASSENAGPRRRLPKWKMPSRVSRTRLALLPVVLLTILALSFSSFSRGVGANVGMRIIPAEQCGTGEVGFPPNEGSPTPSVPTPAQELFATDWFGADRAAGKPDVARDGDVDAFTIENSALWSANGPASFVCRGFSIPQGRHVTPALGLSFATRSTEPLPPLTLPSRQPVQEFEVLPSEPTIEVGPPAGGPTSTEPPAEEGPSLPSSESGPTEPEPTETLGGETSESSPVVSPTPQASPETPALPPLESPSPGPQSMFFRALAVVLPDVRAQELTAFLSGAFTSDTGEANLLFRLFGFGRPNLFAAITQPNALHDGTAPNLDSMLRISLSHDGQDWTTFHTIDQVPVSNQLNGGYYLVDLPKEFAESLDTLQVRIEGVASRSKIEALVDSVFLSFAAGKTYELDVVPTELDGDELDAETDAEEAKHAFGLGQEASFHFKEKDLNRGLLEHFNRWTSDLPEPLVTIDGALLNKDGQTVEGAAVEVSWDKRERFGHEIWDLTVDPPRELPPGKYTVSITFTDEDGNTQQATQDFLWGVLALNVNKSIYFPDETVDFAFAVLDEHGAMVCDADVTLEITHPNRQETLSTQGGTIVVNPECQVKAVTQRPDYGAHWRLSGAVQTGAYDLKLTATTKNGTWSIGDRFEVRNPDQVPFDVHRAGPTRILPTSPYTMTFTVTANQDFEGQIIEPVPSSFVVVEKSDVVEIAGSGAASDEHFGIRKFFRSTASFAKAVGQKIVGLFAQAQEETVPIPAETLGGETSESLTAPSEPAETLGGETSESLEAGSTTPAVLEKGTNEIVWEAKMQKGKTYAFRYSFDAPDISPEFWLTGPLRFAAASAEQRGTPAASGSPTQNNAEPAAEPSSVETPAGEPAGTAGGQAQPETEGGEASFSEPPAETPVETQGGITPPLETLGGETSESLQSSTGLRESALGGENQKASTSETFGELADSSVRPTVNTVSVANGNGLSSLSTRLKTRAVEVRGLEPLKPRLTVGRGEPATPTATPLLQKLFGATTARAQEAQPAAADAEGTQNSTAVEPTQNNAEVPRGSALGSPEGAAPDGGVLRGSALIFEEIRQWQIAADALPRINDGIALYGEGTVTTPRYRNFTGVSFDSELSGATAAATIKHTIIKASPTTTEIIAGIQTSGGTLYIQRWNGSAWSNEWNVAVGDGFLPRFDIAYENTSGTALVVYSGNVATTNELRYRTWISGSWSGELNLDTVRTSAAVAAVAMVAYKGSGSNDIGLAWGDAAATPDLSANYWDGATNTWKGEPSAALSTGLAVDTGVWTDLRTWAFDLEFETNSGDLMVAWGNEAGTVPVYVIRGAGAAGTWGSPTTTTVFAEEPLDMDLSADPGSDGILYVTNSPDTGNDTEGGWWTGSAWPTVAANTPPCEEIDVCLIDNTVDSTGAGTTSNAIVWLVSGTERRAIITYDDANGAGVDWATFDPANVTNNWTLQTDCTTACASQPTGVDDFLQRGRVDPFNASKAVFLFIDGESDLYAKKIQLNSTTLTWSNADGGAALEDSVSSSNPGFAADFAYHKVKPAAVYSQLTYEGYVFENDDEDQAVSDANYDENSVQAGAKFSTAGANYLTNVKKGERVVVRSHIKNTGTGTTNGNNLALFYDRNDNVWTKVEHGKVATTGNGNCTDTDYDCTTVDNTGTDRGQYTAIAFDPSGIPWVSYYDVTSAALAVAQYVGSGGVGCTSTAWSCRLVDDDANNQGQYTSIAIDPKGKAFVSYYDVTASALMVAQYVGTGGAGCGGAPAAWTCETVDNTGTNTGSWTSIAIDENQNPWVSFYDTTNSSLRAATRGGGFGALCTDVDWTCAVVANADDDGSYSAIAISPLNQPWVSYYQNGALDRLAVAQYIGSGGNCTDTAWSCEAVDDTGTITGLYGSIAFDPLGKPWVSFYDSTNSALRAAYRDTRDIAGWNEAACTDTDWRCAATDSAGTVGLWTSLAFDPAGNPWISSFNDDATADSKALKIVRLDGDTTASGCDTGAEGWTCETVDSAGTDAVGEYTAIAFASDGAARVSYYDGGTETALKVAEIKRGGEIVISPSLGGGNSGVALAESHADMTSATDTTERDDTGTSLCVGGTAVVWNNGKLIEAEEETVTVPAGSTTAQCTEVAFVIDTSQATAGGTYRLLLASKDNWRDDKGPWRGVISVAANCGSASNEDCRPKLTIENPTPAGLRASKDNQYEPADCTDTAWGCAAIDDDANNQGQYTSIAIGPTGKVFVSYYDVTATALMVAEYVGAGGTGCGGAPAAWTCTTVDDTGTDKGRYTSIAIDAMGNPWVSYYDVTGSALRVAQFVGGTSGSGCTSTAWTCETVDNTGTDTGSYTSLVFDAGGIPWVSFYDTTNTGLRAAMRGRMLGATCTDEDWTCESVDNTALVGLYSAIAVNSRGVPWISYYEGDLDALGCGAGECLLRVAAFVGSGGSGCTSLAWTCEEVDDTGTDTGQWTSISFDAAGTAWVSYYDTTSTALRVATRGSGTWAPGACTDTDWQCALVDDVSAVGTYSAIAFDASGNAWVSYFNDDATATNKALRAARFHGGTGGSGCTGGSTAWTCVTVDANGADAVGEYTSLAFDPSGTPWLSYYDGVTELSLRVAKLHLPFGKPTPATTIAYPARSAIHGDARYRLDRGKAPATEGAGVCSATADNEGYCGIGTDDTQYDSIVGGTGEWPMYVFSYTHTNNTDTPQIVRHIRTTVATTDANPILIQAYRFGTTNAWETVITLGTAAPNTGCTTADCDGTDVVGGTVGEYYDTSPANTVYWRIVQQNAATLKVEFINATPAAAAGFTISGGCWTTDAESVACTDGGAGDEIRVAVNATLDPNDLDATVDGAWSITLAPTPVAGDVITVFRNGAVTAAERAVSVMIYDGAGNIDQVKLYQGHLTIGNDSTSANADRTGANAFTNLNLSSYDNSVSADADIFYDVDTTTGNDLTMNTTNGANEVFVLAGDEWRPASTGGADTTTPQLEIEATAIFTADNNLVTLNGTGTTVLTVGGTFNANTGTVNYVGTAATTVLGTTYYNLGAGTTLDTTAVVYTLGAVTTANNAITIGNAGSTGTDTFSTSGTNFALTAATITITALGDLTANASTVTITGAGTPLTATGAFTRGTSTVTYTSATGVTALSSVAMTGAKAFYNLTVDSTAGTNQNFPAGVALGVVNQLTVGDFSTLDMTTNALTVGDSGVSNSGDIDVQANGTLTQSASATTIQTSDGGGGTQSVAVGGAGSVTFYNLTFAITNAVASPETFTLGRAAGQTVNIANNLTIGDGSTNGPTVDAEFYDPVVDINGGITISANAAFTASSTVAFRVAGNWTNSGTLNEGTGTVTLDGLTSATVNSGCADPSTGCANQDFANVTINKTDAADANDNVTLTTNGIRVNTTLTITDGELIQGTLNVYAGGASAVSIGAAGKWTNISTGDLKLAGSFSNSGVVLMRASGEGCGDNDDIAITSSVGGTQRAWSGSGYFGMDDVSVQDQGGTASIGVSDGTSVSGNGTNWKFNGCGNEQLTLDGHIFENDDEDQATGDVVDENTQQAGGRFTSPAHEITNAKKGERLTVRMHLKNTGRNGLDSNLALFYDRNDGVWTKVEQGKPATTTAGSCADTKYDCTTVDNTGTSRGQYTSFAYDQSGRPWVSYYDVTGTALIVAQYVGSGGNGCTSTAWTCVAVDDDVNNQGQYTSIAFDTSGKAWVSYYDVTASALMVAQYVGTGGVGCGGSPAAWTCETVDNTGTDTGSWTSIAIDAAGNPWVSFYDTTNTALRVATRGGGFGTTCTDTDWTCGAVDDDADDDGKYSSLAFDNTGKAWISYYQDDTTDQLKVARFVGSGGTGCGGTALWDCEGVDNTGTVTGLWTSLAIGSDGIPWVSYYDSTNSSLRVATRGTAQWNPTGTCTDTDWECDVVDNTDAVGEYSAIAFDPGGNAWVSYIQGATTSCDDSPTSECTLRVAQFVGGASGSCTSTAWNCGAVDNQASTGDVGQWGSLAFSPDGNAWASYYDTANTALKVANIKRGGEIVLSAGVSGASGDGLNESHADMSSESDITNPGRDDANCITATTWNNGKWFEKEEADGVTLPAGSGTSQCTEIAFVIDTSQATAGQAYRIIIATKDNWRTDKGPWRGVTSVAATCGGDPGTSACYPKLTLEANTTTRYSKDNQPKFANCTDTAWGCLIVDGLGATANDGRTTGLAVAPDGSLWASYMSGTDTALKVAYYVGSGGNCTDTAWNCSIVDTLGTSTNDGKDSSITFDALGNPWVSYASGTDTALKVATKGGGFGSACTDTAWTCGIVDGLGTTTDEGRHTSIAVDGSGKPWVSYFDATNLALKVAWYVGSGGNCPSAASAAWSCETVNDGANSNDGRDTSLSFDAQGAPWISYMFPTATDGTLKVAQFVGSGGNCTSPRWNCSVVDDPAGTAVQNGSSSSLAFDASGNPWVSYFSDSDNSLKVATKGGGFGSACTDTAWTCGIVYTGNAGTGANTDIAFDAVGNAWVMFRELVGTDGSVRLARYVSSGGNCTSAAWQCTTIDGLGTATNDGQYLNIAFDHSGTPWVGYMSDTDDALKVGKLHLPFTKPTPATTIAYPAASAIHGDARYRLDFGDPPRGAGTPCDATADREGYCAALADDSDFDGITSLAGELPMLVFASRTTVNTLAPEATWVGQSTVAAGTQNIILQIYRFGTTNAWTTLTTNTTCAASTDCTITHGALAGSASEYFEADGANFWAYYRVYQNSAAETLKTDSFSVAYNITVGGRVFTDEGTSGLNCTTSRTVALRVNGGVLKTAECSNTPSNGTFSITVAQPANGGIVTVYLNDETENATTVFRYASSGGACTPNCTGIDLYQDRVIVRHEDAGPITNANLENWDGTDEGDAPVTDGDIGFDIADAGAAATFGDVRKLLVWTGDTYTPGASVTTSPSSSAASTDGDILIQSTAALSMGTNALSVGGDFTNSGTYSKTAPQTATFTATATGHTITTGSSNFDQVTFNGAGGGWEFTAGDDIEGTLTMTAGTLIATGSQDIWVRGDVTGTGGDINFTGTSNLNHRLGANRNFGSTSGTAGWTFNNLTLSNSSGNGTSDFTATTQNNSADTITVLGVLRIGGTTDTAGNDVTLTGADRTWILSGTGTPLVVTDAADTFTANTSTVRYTGAGATNVTALTGANAYNNLEVQPGANTVTHTLGTAVSQTITVGGNFVAGNGTNTGVVVAAATWDPILDVNGNVTINANTTLTAPDLDTETGFTVGGNWTNNGIFTSGTVGRVTFDATVAGKTLSGTLNGTSSFNQITFNGVGGGWTITAPMLVTVGATEQNDIFIVRNGTVTIGDSTSDNLEVRGGVLIANTAGETGTLQTKQDLAEGSSITIDMSTNTPALCADGVPNDVCIIQVGAASGAGTGTLDIGKNVTVRLNPFDDGGAGADSDTGIEVESTGYLEIQGSQDVAPTASTALDTLELRSTKVCAASVFTAGQHNSKNVRITSGLAIGMIYSISATTVDDVDCASAQPGGDDSITIGTGEGESSVNTAGGLTITGSGPTRTVSGLVAGTIAANDEGIGRYLRDQTATTGYYKIVDSTDGGAGTDSVVIIAEPDAFANLLTTDTVDISDAIRPADTFEILDYAHVTAEAGTACNADADRVLDNGEAYVYTKAGSQTLIQYADICDLGRSVFPKTGIGATNVNGANANEGITVNKSRIYGGFRGVQFDGGTSNNNSGGSEASDKGITNNVIYDHTNTGPFFDGSTTQNNDVSSNRIYQNDSSGIQLQASASRNTISSNYVYDNLKGASAGSGISSFGKANRIINNFIYNHNVHSGSDDGMTVNDNDVASGNTVFGSADDGITTSPGRDNVVIAANTVYTNGDGILAGGTGNVLAGNTAYANGNGLAILTDPNKKLIGNQAYSNTARALRLDSTVSASTGNIAINESYGVSGTHATGDIGYMNTFGHQITLYNSTLASTTEVASATNSGAYVLSLKHDATNGASKIWNDYVIPSDNAETPNNESLLQFNYANNSWSDSFSPHGYVGTGTEDNDSLGLQFAFSGGAMGGAGTAYAYRVVCDNDATRDCDSTTAAGWAVYRYNSSGTETLVCTLGTNCASLNTVFTDNIVLDTSAVNTQLKICGGLSLTVACAAGTGTAYATGDTYTFVIWKASGDTNVQKTVDFQQDSDTLTVPTATTLEIKGDTADCANAVKRTLVRHNAASGSGYQVSVTGTHDLQCANFDEMGGTGQASGLVLNAGSTRAANSLNNTTFDNFAVNVGVNDSYIMVTESLIGSAQPSQTIDGITFNDATTFADWNFNTQTNDALTGYWNMTNPGGTMGSCPSNGEANDADENVADGDPGRFKWTCGITVSGNAYEDEATTALVACDGVTNNISLRVGANAVVSTTCADATGAFTFSGITTPAAGTVMTAYIDGVVSTFGSTVNRYSGSGNVTGMNVRRDRLVVMHDDAGPTVGADLNNWDNDNDVDINFTAAVTTNNLTTEDGTKLIVNTGDTFAPSATVTTDPSASAAGVDGDILIQSTAALSMGTNALSVGGDFVNSGTYSKTAPQTATFTATATGHTIDNGTGNFDNVTFNGTGGGWSFSDASNTIDSDLTVTAGTLSGTTNLTVQGSLIGDGTITMSGSSIVEQRVTAAKNFRSATDTTLWTFVNLTFSNGNAGATPVTITTVSGGTGGVTVSDILRIGKSGDAVGATTTLNATARTWTLSGTGGDPFQILASPAGDLLPGTSTFSYTGNNGAANTTIQAETYNILSPANASETYVLEGSTTTTAASTIPATGAVFDLNGFAYTSADRITVDGTIQGSGDLTVNGRWAGLGTVTMTGGTTKMEVSVAENFNHSGSATTWTFNDLTFSVSGATPRTITTVNGTGGIIVNGILRIGESGDSAATTLSAGNKTWTLSGTGGDPFQILASPQGVLTGSTSSFNFTGNNAGGATTVEGSPTTSYYYNLTINNSAETYNARSATTARNQVTVTAGTYAFGANSLTVGNSAVANSGTISVAGTLSQTVSATTTVQSSDGGSATVGGAGSITFYNLTFNGTAGVGVETFTLGSGASQTITVSNTMTVGDGTNGGVVTAETNDPILDVNGAFTIAAAGTFTASSTAAFSVGGSWSNSATGVFSPGTGTVVFDDGGGDGQETIADGADAFANIDFNGSGGDWLYTDGSSTAPTTTDMILGTAQFVNTKTGTASRSGGTLLVDWYLSVHLVDQAAQATNINTTEDDSVNGDVIVSEAGGNSTLYRNGGPAWGTASSSQRTGTGADGHIPQPNNNGAIRLREYSWSGVSKTFYRYNLEVENQNNWQYGEFDYYDDLGQNYITSVDNTGANLDSAIGVNWYRSPIGTENAHPTINEPPTTGTWYVGLITGLSFSLSSTSITIPELNAVNSFTDASQTTTATISTSASLGYRLTLWATQLLTRTGGAETIWMFDDGGVVPNSAPTDWAPADTCQSGANQCGFGYNTNDSTLASPGSADRFTGAGCGADAKCWAGFPTAGSGDLVGDSALRVSGVTHVISYKLSVDVTRAAGAYTSTLTYVLTAQY